VIQSGFIRGIGHKIGAAAVFVSTGYLFVGIPAGYALAYPLNLDLVGLWLGAIACCLYLAIGFTIIIQRLNWDVVFEEVESRKA
jgi:Na+-driven multidrug efflux pump